MLQKLKDKFAAFLQTKTGHALEHGVTAAAATALGLLISAQFHGGIHASDVSAAVATFSAGVAFTIRTLLRNAGVDPADFTPGFVPSHKK